jgi:hypothetical protein
MSKKIIASIAKENRCRRGTEVDRELAGIHSMVSSAQLLIFVRREIQRLGMNDVSVVDGNHCDEGKYEAVIRSVASINESSARRIRSGSLGNSTEIERIADNMIGINRKRS